MISINATLVLQVVHLLILILILNRLLFKPIQKVINERTAFIGNSKGEIREIEIEIERLKNEHLSQEKMARREASQEGQDLKNIGLRQVEGLVEEAQKKVASIRIEAGNLAEVELKATRPKLRDEASLLCEVIIERMIGRRIAN
ncbi:MAG: hypothetical protein V1758_06960 [Pseudomonadota bacterium]